MDKDNTVKPLLKDLNVAELAFESINQDMEDFMVGLQEHQKAVDDLADKYTLKDMHSWITEHTPLKDNEKVIIYSTMEELDKDTVVDEAFSVYLANYAKENDLIIENTKGLPFVDHSMLVDYENILYSIVWSYGQGSFMVTFRHALEEYKNNKKIWKIR